MKMTFEFNEQMNQATMKSGETTVQVTETEDNWDRFFVVSNHGIRINTHDVWNLKQKCNHYPTLWMFKCAYEFFETERTRKEEMLSDSTPKLEENVE